MQTYFYLGVGSGVGPASIRSSSVTGTTGSNHRATNDNMPPPSDAVGDPTTTADGDDASLVVKSTLERMSPGRISPLLAAAHQMTVPGFNPGLILMCRQAVAVKEAAMQTATVIAVPWVSYVRLSAVTQQQQPSRGLPWQGRRSCHALSLRRSCHALPSRRSCHALPLMRLAAAEVSTSYLPADSRCPCPRRLHAS